jgi:osmotically-inducible protein OsmY
LVSAILVGVVVAGAACTQEPVETTTGSPVVVTVDKPNAGSSDTSLEAAKAAGEKNADVTTKAADTKNPVETIGDKTKEVAVVTADKTKEIAVKTADKTKEIAVKTADKTEDIARAVGTETKKIVSATGEVITDGWITANVSARFVDEALLKGSNINVDTTDHAVTLKGTVKSDAAKARAGALPAAPGGEARRQSDRRDVGGRMGITPAVLRADLRALTQKEVSDEKSHHRYCDESVCGVSGGRRLRRHPGPERRYASRGHGRGHCGSDHHVPARRRRIAAVSDQPGRGVGIPLGRTREPGGSEQPQARGAGRNRACRANG